MSKTKRTQKKIRMNKPNIKYVINELDVVDVDNKDDYISYCLGFGVNVKFIGDYKIKVEAYNRQDLLDFLINYCGDDKESANYLITYARYEKVA